MKKLIARIYLLIRAALEFFFRYRQRPPAPRKVLVLGNLLLGDTLMLAPLLSALRERYQKAEVFVAVTPKYQSLFDLKPYGVTAMPLDLKNSSLLDIVQAGPYDLACVPGDNRYALTARALGARWIVALAGDRPGWKNRICDELVSLPEHPTTIYDTFSTLATNTPPVRYLRGAWQVAPAESLPQLANNYIILHVGTSSVRRRWNGVLWARLASTLSLLGHKIYWSAGPGEESLVREADPQGLHEDTSGKMDLRQLWHAVRNADLLVSADSGIVHIAKLTNCPTVCLYGPGAEILVGKGTFFSECPISGVTIPTFPDRRDGVVFKRKMPWANAAFRSLSIAGEEAQLCEVTSRALALLNKQGLIRNESHR